MYRAARNAWACGPALVSCEELDDIAPPPDSATSEHGQPLADLASRLAAARTGLKATTQELERLNATLQESKESLATIREERDCSDQELRFVEQRLISANAELHSRFGQLTDATADLDLLSRASGEPRVYLDAQLRLVRVAPEASALFCFRDTDIGRRIMDFNHQLDYPDLLSDLQAVLKSQAPCRREVGDRHGSRWLVTLLPVTLCGPDTPRIVMTCTDISSQHHLLQQQRVVDAMAGQVAVLDRLGAILLVNRAWRERLGRAEHDSALGLPVGGPGTDYLDACKGDALLNDNDSGHLAIGLKAVLAGSQQAFTGTYPRHTSDAQRWLLVRAAPLVDGYCVVTHVHTSQSADPASGDSSRRGHGEKLDLPGSPVVWPGTQTTPASDADDVAVRTKQRFLTHMSHELRTPINSVMGMTHLALRRATDPQQIDFLKKSLVASEHLLAIIGNILDFAQLDAAGPTPDEEIFSLAQMIDDTLRLQGQSAQAKGLHLSRTIAPALPELLCGDALRLKKILRHFVGNAIKFSKSGSITVGAQALEEDGHSLLLRLEVSDQGMGLSPEEQTRLFQPFTQADDSSTRSYGGTGLGLAIAKRLANLLGGDVGVISETGRGSTFWATVRVRPAPAVEAGAKNTRAA